jgi:hypothetical protein
MLNATFNNKTMIQEFGYDYDAIGNMAYRSKTIPGAYTGQYVPAKPEYLCQCKRA